MQHCRGDRHVRQERIYASLGNSAAIRSSVDTANRNRRKTISPRRLKHVGFTDTLTIETKVSTKPGLRMLQNWRMWLECSSRVGCKPHLPAHRHTLDPAH